MTNLRNAQNYNIGLDLGTGSVGWAVTDENGNLYRFKGKPTWGSRLFDSANPAADARVYRGQRRRYDRRRQRLNLLQMMFKDEIAKIDPDFFIRLNQSRLWKEDRAEGHSDYRWPFFDTNHPLVISGKTITEPEYYELFPTIYHLRAWLLRQEEQVDIRLIYLAFHNIVKHRGNFLYQDQGPRGLSAQNADLKGVVTAFVEAFNDWVLTLGEEHPAQKMVIDEQKLYDVLSNESLDRKEKKKKAVECFSQNSVDEKKVAVAFLDAFMGYKANLTSIFEIRTSDDQEFKINLSEEDRVGEFQAACPDEDKPLFERMLAVYSGIVLNGILHTDNAETFWRIGTCGFLTTDGYKSHGKTALAGYELQNKYGTTISASKVVEYGRYKENLAELKSLVKEYFPDTKNPGRNSAAYNEFFRGFDFLSDLESGEAVRGKGHKYVKYASETAKGYTLYDLGTSKRSYDDFIKDVQKLFSIKFSNGTTSPNGNTELAQKAAEDERIRKMMKAFDEGTFLRRLKTSDNGAIPFQLHLEEMTIIINNQSAYYPFLSECHTTTDGETRNKLESLVIFRIPYYVGPLTQKNAARNESGNRFAWSKRQPGKKHEKIYPWNWDEIIDKEASADAFMHRMVGSCTYLLGEPVLPKSSLLYEKYCVYNELNGAYYEQDGKRYRFDFKDREGIVEDLFKRKSSVSYKSIVDWLAQRNRVVAKVGGGQGERGFESKLTSYQFFCELFSTDELTPKQEEIAEDLIEWNTLFEDRAILRRKIQSVYGSILDENQIKQVCKKPFTGWGRLSKKLLTGIKAECDEGPVSIMDVLVDGYPNYGDPGRTFKMGEALVFMQILNDEIMGFQKKIDEYNASKVGDSLLSIDDLPYASPALRRSINQALRIIDEIVSIAKCPPANIYIESTRDDDDVHKKGKRTSSRIKSIKNQLKNLREQQSEELKSGILEQLSEHEKDIDNDRYMLYFLQNGKCMYSGRPLDIRKLSTYQIDHILPQSYIKDDSLENRVLVYAEENQRKTDTLLLDSRVQKKMKYFWLALKDAGLIGEKKYNNLMRKTIDDKQMKGFINRQIVETSQVVKFVKQMLAQRYPAYEDGSGTHVRTIKAGISHQIRIQWDNELDHYVWRFPKVREMNDYHHAHDAYLAAEVGRFISIRFPYIYDNPLKAAGVMKKYIEKVSKQYQETGKAPAHSFIPSSFLKSGFDKETGEIFRDSWDAEAELERMGRYFDIPDCYISRMPNIDSGAFSDETLFSPRDKKKGSNLALRLKGNLPTEKYGGYSREQFAYFFIFEKRDKKRNLVFDFAPVPVSVAASVQEGGIDALEEYSRSLLAENEEFVRIVRPILYRNQVLEIDGCRVLLRGKKEVRNAAQLFFNKADALIIAALVDGTQVDSEQYLRLFDSCSTKIAIYAKVLEDIVHLKSYRETFNQASSEAKKGNYSFNTEHSQC
ncbi:MAG: type II CRISPR RNA-guided endonuclease Cas9 [Eggerthellaceae bacterium]|jgi:CRISPR-associated endonuclease Csn1